MHGGGFTGTADDLSARLGFNWRFGTYRFYDDIPSVSRSRELRQRKKKRRRKRRDEPVVLPGFSKSLDSPEGRPYTHKVPLGWKGPISVPGGERYAAPGGKAYFEIIRRSRNSKDWAEPREFRRRLRDLGMIADRHVLDTVRITDRFGSRVRYTTHFYHDHWHIGERRDDFYTEEIYIPERLAYFLIRYRAPKDLFLHRYPGYQAFLKSLAFAKSADYEPEEFYRLRDHVLEDIVDDDVRLDTTQRIPRRILFDKRLQAGFALSKPAGFSFNIFYSLSDHWSAGAYYGLAKMEGHKGLGLRGRLHLRDVMSSGPYLFSDLGAVSAQESEARLSNPAAGLGWLHLWKFYFVDAGYGYGPKRESFQGLLYLSGGMRF